MKRFRDFISERRKRYSDKDIEYSINRYSPQGDGEHDGANMFGARDYSNYRSDMKRAGVAPRSDQDAVNIEFRNKGKSPQDRLERVRRLRQARDIFNNQVLPDLKVGDHVYNEPLSNADGLGGNKRADIYRRFGMGPLDPGGGQHGVVGKTPRGFNNKLFPLGPRRTHDD